MSPSSCEPAVSVTGLVKVYPGLSAPAVDHLTLEIPRGSIFGLLGPNGAGKTTTISILCTLLKPTAGCARVFGQDVVSQATAVRQSIGLVPQEIALYPTLTARENLRYFAQVLKVSRRDAAREVDSCLDLVGLLEVADRRVSSFSGGMKRRANLAVAILHRPPLLLLDEPTVGIDAQSRNLILERLKQLKSDGMTLLYTSHYMEEVQEICDSIAIIDSGRVVAAGAPTRLIKDAPQCVNLEELFLSLTGKDLRD
ncbi:MAG: ABC transporter [Desulfuromonas sp.]|nr:MAG: ABC transporter [Desulfuromonas sp.]